MLSTHPHLGRPSGLFPSGSPTTILYAFPFSPPFMLHALPISYSLTSSFQLYLARSTSYEAPHCKAFYKLLSLHLSSVKIFSSTPYSVRQSFYIPPSVSETKFHNHLYLGLVRPVALVYQRKDQTTFVRNYILPCLYYTRVIRHVSAIYKPSSGISCIKC
jgi:hypothetical protein